MLVNQLIDSEQMHCEPTSETLELFPPGPLIPAEALIGRSGSMIRLDTARETNKCEKSFYDVIEILNLSMHGKH